MGSFKLSLALVFLCCSALSFAQNSPQDYLDAHNTARQQAAAGLPPFSWDQSLESYAQNYANGVLQGNSCDNLVHSGGPHGENLAAASPDLTGADAVAMWVSEGQDYDYGANTCAAGKECGHYTQVVWKNSVRLGCARVHCDNNWSYVICSYDPPGNVNGDRPY